MAGTGSVGEPLGPLSASLLWQAQGAYFERAGVTPWASGELPHAASTGPVLAAAYAQIVEGFLDDCAAGRFGPVDLAEPVHLVELGAGPGRLAFHFLRSLDTSASPLRLVYVLTDLAQANLEFWRGHERLQPFFDDGRLELARFDATGDATLTLERSGRVLAPGTLANPMVAVANYLFDVIPQDLFVVEEGRLREELVAVVGDQGPDDQAAPDFFQRVRLTTGPGPVGPDRYDHPDLNRLLAWRAAQEEGPGPDRFLFPAPALRCLGHLAELAAGRLLLLTAERPDSVADIPPDADAGDRPEGVRPRSLFAMAVHGSSFSCPVDLTVLDRFVEDRAGTMLLPAASPAGLLVAGFLTGDTGGAPATRHRFALAVDEGGPEDVHLTLRATLDRGTEGIPLALLLAMLRTGGYDPYLMSQLRPGLEQALPDATPAGAEEAVRAFRRVLDADFPLHRSTDVAFWIAMLLAPAGYHVGALEFLAESRDRRGPNPRTAYNTGLCLAYLGRTEEAMAALEEAVALDPGFDAAADLLDQVRRGEVS